MTAPVQSAIIAGWSPIRQWMLSGVVLLSGWMAFLFHWDLSFSFYAAYVALMLFSFMNPVINAMRANLAKNLLLSIPLYAGHAFLCHLLLRQVSTKGMELNVQLFMAIVILYVMSNMLGILFRSIYILLTEHL